MWNPTTGRRIGKPMINGMPNTVNRGEISVIACVSLPDGRCVATLGSEDERLTFWDLECQRPITELTGQGWIHAAAPVRLANGRAGLVTGHSTVTAWDLSTLPETTNDSALAGWRDEFGIASDPAADQLRRVLEIDLDAPVRALTVNDNGIVVGTTHGIVQLQLHRTL
jgi:WD40 repeat protein